jgi:hypothetical protein
MTKKSCIIRDFGNGRSWTAWRSQRHLKNSSATYGAGFSVPAKAGTHINVPLLYSGQVICTHA